MRKVEVKLGLDLRRERRSASSGSTTFKPKDPKDTK